MKIICIGRNYADHAKELNNAVPTEPVFFMKPDTAYMKNNSPFYIPSFSNDIHYEAELVIKINKNCKSVNLKFSGKYFSQISVGIDFTARDLQQKAKEKGLPWEIAKAFDNSAPVGTFININCFNNLSDIQFSLNINGEQRQSGNSADMIFSMQEIVAYVSKFISLKAGDLIFTGTPAGVGKINIGDKLEAFIGDNKLLECNIM